MKTELATKWNRLDKDDKLEIIQEAIDGWSVSDGSLFLRLFRDGSIVGYIQDEPDNHLTVEAVSVSTLGILFGDNHSYSVGDEQAILDWMESHYDGLPLRAPSAKKIPPKSSAKATRRKKRLTTKKKKVMITKEEAKKNQAAIVKRLLARKNKRMTPEQVIEQGKKLHAKRKYWGEVDAAKSGKKRLAPTYNNLMRWVQHPGTYDLIGVDVSADAEPTLVARQVKKSKVMGLFGL